MFAPLLAFLSPAARLESDINVKFYGTRMTNQTHSSSSSSLLEPATLGSLPLRNRLLMAPLTRTRADSDGTPNALMVEYYAQRASAGLIIAEAATPNAVGQTYPDIPGIHTAAHVAGWRQVTDAVHSRGGLSFLQLQHGGRVGHPATSGLIPVAPSAVPLPETVFTRNGHLAAVTPHVLTVPEIRETAADFASAARNAIAAGFDGVEVHSANGYLLHQFLAGNTNLRTDGYGGTAENRVSFVLEVVRAVIDAIGAERVGVRLSPGSSVNGIREDDTEDIYRELVGALAAAASRPIYLHLIGAEADSPIYRQIRRDWPGTLIANPRLPYPGQLPVDGGQAAGERLLDAGADLIALGRAFIANPDLVERIHVGAPLNPLRDGLMYVGGSTGYTDYPTLGSSDSVARRDAVGSVTVG